MDGLKIIPNGNKDVYINRQYVLSILSINTVKCWGLSPLKLGNQTYYSYSAIPAPSRAKLPSLEELFDIAKNEQKGSRGAYYRDKIQDYTWKHYVDLHRYIGEKYPEVRDLDRAKSARMWCAWKYFVEYMGHLPYGEGDLIRAIFNDKFGKKYTKQHFSKIFQAMKRDGIEAHVIDKRSKGNNKDKKKYGESLWLRFAHFFMEDRKYPITRIREYLLEEFDRNEVPCITMLRTKQKEWERNPAMYAQRYGEKMARQQLPFVSMKTPEGKNVIWLIDGVVIPFYTKGSTSLERWSLIRVMDLGTRQVLSVVVDKEENSVGILSALEKAIRKENRIPTELVMDKHSATKTEAFKQFKSQMEAMGCVIEITTDPTKKAHIERYNQYLNDLFSEYAEYLGQGIAAKNPRRRNPETMKELVKSDNQITPDETIARGLFVCDRYNKTNLNPLGGISPNEKAETTENKGLFVSSSDFVKLFTAPKEMKVTRGMVIMKQGIQKCNYTLSKDGYQKHNNTKVIVHYESFGGSIYLFDMKGDFIESIDPDTQGNWSKAERIENTQPLPNIGKSTQLKKESDRLLEGLKANPESLAFIPSYQINKSAYAEIQRERDLKRIANVEGLQIYPKTEHVVNVPGERHKRKHYSPDMDDNEVADLGGFADPILRKNDSQTDKQQ